MALTASSPSAGVAQEPEVWLTQDVEPQCPGADAGPRHGRLSLPLEVTVSKGPEAWTVCLNCPSLYGVRSTLFKGFADENYRELGSGFFLDLGTKPQKCPVSLHSTNKNSAMEPP